jgi:pyruvate,water dikinase
MKKMKYVRFFEEISSKDLSLVGGKNSSLGEMIKFLKKKNILVPDGFAITSKGYFRFLEANKLEKNINSLLKKVAKDKKNLSKIGSQIRNLILSSKIPKDLEDEIVKSYEKLSSMYKTKNVDVAIRSSATAEDLPTASFAGQLESFLNIKGTKNVSSHCLKCYSSLFTDRAIAYREEKGFSSLKIALSIGIQKMVRSDKAGSGVIFTLDTESGFRDVITITAGFGLGENIVQGTIIPDEYQVFKPFLNKRKKYPIIEKVLGEKSKKLIYCKKKFVKNIKTTTKERCSFVLNEKEIIKLAKVAEKIEKHYKKPMDIEWAKDGIKGEIYVVQARPETVQSQIKKGAFKNYFLQEKKKPILTGIAIGESIAVGKVQIIKSPKDMKKFKKGSILVTFNTTPDWVPIMKQAAGIITDHGGRTSHAAIVSRELNIPAIVGTCIGTKILKNDQEITLSCEKGDKGFVYNGKLKYSFTSIDLSKIKKPKTKIMINIASPRAAFKWWQLPISGIGLARMEFIINNEIQIHPMALVKFKSLKNLGLKRKIEKLTSLYKKKTDYFVDILSRSIAKIAASQYPNDVIVRLSDFKTNEYSELLGGECFEEKEENPMLGFRGASRYYSEKYKEAFKLECLAIKKTREYFGFENVIVMVPFCRTLKEAEKVINILGEYGLKRGSQKLKIYVMAEIPSNVILAKKFSKYFDGFSIGSNDLTQLILGVDRDSENLKDIFDARDEAVKTAIRDLIKKAHSKGRKVGICGQAPSDHPDFAKFLIDQKIDSISLNPDSVISVLKKLT